MHTKTKYTEKQYIKKKSDSKQNKMPASDLAKNNQVAETINYMDLWVYLPLLF